MTTAAIMQPYLFPYLGYWQMVNLVDIFVSLDDVNFIKKGWINRNNILLSGRPHLFTLPLTNASQNRLIRETQISASPAEKQTLLRTIAQCYAKAPYFNHFYPVVEAVINYPESNLAKFLHHHFTLMFDYMGISTKLLVSSEIEKTGELKAQNRIIDICRRLEAKTYINAIGGMDIYDPERFKAEGMDMKFIRMRQVPYQQFKTDFVPGLSIIDVLMFNDCLELQPLLNAYDLM